MGIEQIVTKIIEEAREKASRLRSEFDGKVQQIESRWEEESRLRKEEFDQALEEAARKERERMITAEKLESRKRRLTVRHELVDQAFAAARSAFLDLPGSEYASLLAGIIARASETGTETVVLGARDSAELGEKVVKQANDILKKEGKEASLTLADDPGDFDAGALLCHDRVEIRQTLDELLGEIRERIEGQVAAVLFEEDK